MKFFLIFCINLTFLLFSGCNNDDDDVQPPPEDTSPPVTDTRHTVQMAGNSFSPANLTINVGDTVVWMNSGTMIHTSTSGTDCGSDGTWNSGNLNPGETFSFEFKDEGSFDYFCMPHCNLGMVGNITVED